MPPALDEIAMENQRLDWFGIRTVYHFGQKDQRTNLFEERVCVFSGADFDEAFQKAQQEADEYAEALKIEWYPHQESYLQDGDDLIDGYEVYSKVFEFAGDLETFYRERYQKYDYTPVPELNPDSSFAGATGSASPQLASAISDLRWVWRPFADLDSHTLYRLLTLRSEIFVVEQDCVYLDMDGIDPDCHHLIGWNGEELVAYLRVIPPGVQRPEMVIGRVVTHSSIRGQGFGRPLMEEGMRRGIETFGDGPIWLGGQAHLVQYYRSLGFEVCGDGYLEDGIPHLPMCRQPATD